MSGYSNYNDQYTSNREYDLERSERPKIAIALWPEQLASNESRSPVCEFDPHIKLQLVDNGSMWFCRECGNKTPIAEVKQDRKLVRKHGTRSTSTMITSLAVDKAKRKPKSSRELQSADTTSLTSADIEEFRGWGLKL